MEHSEILVHIDSSWMLSKVCSRMYRACIKHLWDCCISHLPPCCLVWYLPSDWMYPVKHACIKLEIVLTLQSSGLIERGSKQWTYLRKSDSSVLYYWSSLTSTEAWEKLIENSSQQVKTLDPHAGCPPCNGREWCLIHRKANPKRLLACILSANIPRTNSGYVLQRFRCVSDRSWAHYLPAHRQYASTHRSRPCVFPRFGAESKKMRK